KAAILPWTTTRMTSPQPSVRDYSFHRRPKEEINRILRADTRGTMAVHRELRVLVATDGSAAAKAAVATAARFPWPAGTRALAVVARQVPRSFRRSILLASLDRSADVIAAGARRGLSRRWPDTEVTIVDTAAVPAVLNEAKRFRADAI